MGYTVTAPLVIIPNADEVSGDGYFYVKSLVPDGWNDERCKQLAEDGMLEKVSTEDSSNKEPTVKEILDEVGDDKDKATAALEQEKAGKNRKTLVEPLEAILAKS